MKCIKCGSLRIIKFIDGFRRRRLFCENCKHIFPFTQIFHLKFQKTLQDFDWRRVYPSLR